VNGLQRCTFTIKGFGVWVTRPIPSSTSACTLGARGHTWCTRISSNP
jgi:hypothetical protein